MASLASQPLKTAYTLGAIGFELVRLPLWLIKYITTYGRPHPDWSLRQALGVRAFYAILYHLAVVKAERPVSLEPAQEKERFVLIDALDDSYYQGPLRSNDDVKPTNIGATWYPAPLTPSSDTSSLMVILHFHGGAYVLGDGRTAATGYSAKRLLKYTYATHVFAPQYRLATLPASKTSNPFPAALQDCLTSYLYLVNELKISPSNIVFSGDSAGGNAVIATLRYIAEYGAGLKIPSPFAAVAWSPWIQPAESVTDDFLRNNANYPTDYISFPFSSWGAFAYAGLAGEPVLSSPYISFKGKPFKTEVPLWVTAGGAEVLFSQVAKFVEEMKSVGNNVSFDVEKAAPHDILALGSFLGFDKEVASMVEKVGDWLETERSERE